MNTNDVRSALIVTVCLPVLLLLLHITIAVNGSGPINQEWSNYLVNELVIPAVDQTSHSTRQELKDNNAMAVLQWPVGPASTEGMPDLWDFPQMGQTEPADGSCLVNLTVH